MNAQSAKDDEYDEELDDEELDDEEEDDEEEDDEELDDDEEFDDDELAAAAPEEEDPTWWAPYGVLGVLLLIGLLGFFGMFNSCLGFLAAPAGGDHAAAETASAQPTAAAMTAKVERPDRPVPKAAAQTYGAKHILVMYEGSRRAPSAITRTKEEAKKRAAEAAQKAKKGAKFEELVKEYSDEPGAAARGGNLGRFRKGTMVPAFQAAVEKMKVGDVSDPVETPFGFHVIVRTH